MNMKTSWQTRLWHWTYARAVDYEYGEHGKRKSPRRARLWTRLNNALCWALDRIGRRRIGARISRTCINPCSPLMMLRFEHKPSWSPTGRSGLPTR